MINNNNPIAAMLLRVPHDVGLEGGGGEFHHPISFDRGKL